MKRHLKYGLAKLNLFQFVDGLRRLPMIIDWVRLGCTGLAPPPIKRKIIRAYLKKYKLTQFIETGTHLGDTLAYIAQDQEIQCHSIELSRRLHEQAVDRFKNWPNANVCFGDSGQVLPKLIQDISAPTLFWLDGHYSGGVTAKGRLNTPISAELQAILSCSLAGEHIILIDDIRCFDGTQDYPYLDQLLAAVRAKGLHQYEVSADILRLTPKEAQP